MTSDHRMEMANKRGKFTHQGQGYFTYIYSVFITKVYFLKSHWLNLDDSLLPHCAALKVLQGEVCSGGVTTKAKSRRSMGLVFKSKCVT